MLGALRSLALACPLLLTSFGTSSCSFGCTEAACGDFLELRLHDDGRPLPAGEYAIEVVVDGELVRCEGVIPAEGDILSCVPDGTVAVERGAEGELEALRFDVSGTPRELAIEVRNAGGVIANESVEPRYERYRPNGAGCPPECRVASVDVKLAFE